MTVGITELPPEGMQLGGVALAGDTERGTKTTEGLSLLFTSAGITVQGPQPQIERLLVWSGLDSATCREKIVLPDGRNAAVMELTSGGQSIRFLFPTETVTPGQAAYLDQALPHWLARYKGAPPAPATPAATNGSGTAPGAPAPAAGNGSTQATPPPADQQSHLAPATAAAAAAAAGMAAGGAAAGLADPPPPPPSAADGLTHPSRSADGGARVPHRPATSAPRVRRGHPHAGWAAPAPAARDGGRDRLDGGTRSTGRRGLGLGRPPGRGHHRPSGQEVRSLAEVQGDGGVPGGVPGGPVAAALRSAE